MPFRNYSITKGGALTIGSVHSPGFTLSPLSGWSIDKNGAAYFESVTIGGGVVRVTFAASAPSSPNVGDVWFNLSAGAQPNVWSGSAWTAYQWGTSSIANAAIGLSQLANTVTARALNGITTTISATAPGSPVAGDIWIDTANGNQLQQWSGSAWVPITWTATDVIAANTITAALIAANTITAGQIAAGTITATQIAANTITASQISAGAIGTTQLAANAVTAAKIAANTITAAQIAAATITATQIASGTITGTQIAASIGLTTPTITGTDFVLNANGIFVYSGAPAAGNLAASMVPGLTSGTDAHGNTYYPGVCSYGYVGGTLEGVELIFGGNYLLGTPTQIAHFIAGSVGVTQPAALGLTSAGVGGEDIILSGGTSVSTNTNAAIELIEGTSTAAGTINLFASDVQIQDGATSVIAGVGHIRGFAAGQTINTAAFTTITGLSILLGARKYFFRARLFINANTSNGQFQVEITAPAGTSATNYSFKWESGAGVSALNVNRTTFSTALGGPAASVSGPYWVTIEGTTTLSAAGSLVVKGLDTGTPGTDTWTVFAGSYFEAFPVA